MQKEFEWSIISNHALSCCSIFSLWMYCPQHRSWVAINLGHIHHNGVWTLPWHPRSSYVDRIMPVMPVHLLNIILHCSTLCIVDADVLDRLVVLIVIIALSGVAVIVIAAFAGVGNIVVVTACASASASASAIVIIIVIVVFLHLLSVVFCSKLILLIP